MGGNVNVSGDGGQWAISVVATPLMSGIARIPTCLMPHGMRLNRQGTRAYMTCMMDDKVVEIDPASYAIMRVLTVRPSTERVTITSSAMAPGEMDHQHATMSHDAPGGSTSASSAPPPRAPTGVQPSADRTRPYVARNRHAAVPEVDGAPLVVTRRLPAGKSPSHRPRRPARSTLPAPPPLRRLSRGVPLTLSVAE